MLIVGIAGGTGSGKTTVVNKLLNVFPNGEVIVIPQDAYYRDNGHIPLEERQKINFDHPDSLEFDLLIDHLRQLKKGKAIEMPVYSYLTCLRAKETITVRPAKVVIVEGILILADEGLRKMFDIKVFVDADADDRLGRVIQRDIAERGRSVLKVLERYHDTVKPSHLQFIEPSKRYADIIIPRGGENEVGIEVLVSIIEKHLNKTPGNHA
ncbi:MAG TPA: uridine kinase [Bacteroidales bacterium]|jgi:uridine kinase|nr:uridine kinase [Bacteroidales bacterium]OQB61941.1 MAG: Uridine kinase [Bacteroidetes bacterium ADurb.Bin145]HOU01909.1 uridine kinase [Bacteroidales bacterium]HQG62596.1 uridine kinase [Bacteroidales bacterium]HQK67317.1 uridine kinase [Bacteroidales bacterium]